MTGVDKQNKYQEIKGKQDKERQKKQQKEKYRR